MYERGTNEGDFSLRSVVVALLCFAIRFHRSASEVILILKINARLTPFLLLHFSASIALLTKGHDLFQSLEANYVTLPLLNEASSPFLVRLSDFLFDNQSYFICTKCRFYQGLEFTIFNRHSYNNRREISKAKGLLFGRIF